MGLTSSITSGFSTLRLVLKEGAEPTPVGVAGWDSGSEWFDLRLSRETERLPGLRATERSLVAIAAAELRSWAGRRKVPYAGEPVAPWHTRFWSAAATAFTTGFRLDPPRPLAPEYATPEGLEALFEAIVQPQVAQQERQRRIDGLITAALGDLTRQLHSRTTVPAFGGARERVMRGRVRPSGAVLVEGVNLAGRNARRDADAIMSRIRRIQEGIGKKPTTIIVGYLASPGGLNGEEHMKEWIEVKATQHVFDVNRQADRLRATAREALQQLGLQRGLKLEGTSASIR